MGSIKIFNEEEKEGLRRSGRLAAEVLDFITPYVKDGVSTLELDNLCHQMILDNGATSACLGYHGYPRSTCISVNHVVCHGIPSATKILKNGDIVNIDVTTILDGYYGDTSRMYFVGEPSIKAKRLCKITYDSLMIGIEQAKVGNHIGDIGFAIQEYVEKNGYSVVRDYCGHGTGLIFHTDPQVPHFGKKGSGELIREGMCFTIEPMVNAGRYETTLNHNDGWTVTTRDKSLSAQFEHTLVITTDGCEIMTKSPKGLDFPPYAIGD